MIPIQECKEGYLYYVYSRNLDYAVYHNGMFYGIRNKFGDQFIDYEVPRESGGTVVPKKEIIECPVSVSDEKALFDWLKENYDGMDTLT